MTTSPIRELLGTGWRFPPDPGRGSFALRAGAALVRQSILVILGTDRGERLMRPTFGCSLRRYVMRPNNPATRAAIAREVTAAIDQWEPRVRLDGVDVQPTDDPSVVTVQVTYTLLRDQSLDAVTVALPVGDERTDRLS